MEIHHISAPIDVCTYGTGRYDVPEAARITFTEATLTRVRELRTLVTQQDLDHAGVTALPDLKVEWLVEDGGGVGELRAWRAHDDLNLSQEPVLVGADHVTYAENSVGARVRLVCDLEEAFRAVPPLSQHERERQGLARLIDALIAKGWAPYRVYDGEASEPVKGKPTDEIVEVCAATEDSHLYFDAGAQRRGHLYLVWGNSPSELVCDHSMNYGFDESVAAALREVFPGYPNCED